VPRSGLDDIRQGRNLADLELRQALGRIGAPELTTAFSVGQDTSLLAALFAVDSPLCPAIGNSYSTWLARQEKRRVQD
jgi:hypothetical protein